MASVSETFDKMTEKLTADPTKVANMNCVYQFNVTGEGGGEWYVNLTGATPEIAKGVHATANCTVTMVDEDFIAVTSGALNPQMAFMTGKIRISGDMGLAMKLGKILG